MSYRTITRRASNSAALLAALALAFGTLIPRPCHCLGCEAVVGQPSCCCSSVEGDCPGGACCAKPCCAKHTPPLSTCDGSEVAECIACDHCNCNAAPEPAIAVSASVAHEELAPSAVTLACAPAAILVAQSPIAFRCDAAFAGSPPGIRLHALYSVWLN